MRNISKAVSVAVGVTSALAFVAPMAQAGEMGTMHYSCGHARPPQLDDSPFVSAISAAGVRRGSSEGCGLNGTMARGDKLDYYCYTRGIDGETWTFLSVYERGFAGWVRDTLLPNNGSSDRCPF
ncbi:hypothetical protein [Saccharothrix sp. ALI-22-I]|uniref:hypothetical protein n=1 Tax=Saccharothrix sp. ALI-22-I TaxID=1933778 RepID=UPI00097C0A29|nr:hypothetical protein [Saccharothrix sp. ALI-22-I]